MSNATTSAVGQEVRRLRRARGLTLRDLGEKATLDYSYIGKIERGQRATTDVYEQIARALGTTLGALFAPASGRRRPAA